MDAEELTALIQLAEKHRCQIVGLVHDDFVISGGFEDVLEFKKQLDAGKEESEGG